MKNIWQLYKLDWRRIFKSVSATLLILALIIIPSLYCWFNVWALWDPYSNTADLKVAVYSDDESTTFSDKKIDIGSELIVQLKKNKKLGWQFVDSKKALDQGVKDGTYYAGIYIPKEFSKDLLSFVNGKIKKPTLVYSVNQKINAIAPKITNSGASTLQSTISSEFVTTVGKTLMTVFNDVGYNLDTNLPMINRLTSLILKTQSQIPEIDGYAQQVLALQTKMPEIESKLTAANQFISYMPQVNQLANKVVGLNHYVPMVQQAGALATSVQKKIPQIEDAGTQLATVSNNFSTVETALNDGLTEANNAISILDSVQTVLPEITKFGTDLQTGTTQIKEDLIPKIQAALPTIKTAVSSGLTLISTFSQNVTDDLTKLNALLAQLEADPTNVALKAQIKALLSDIQTNLNQAQTLATNLSTLLTNVQNFNNQINTALNLPAVHLLDSAISQLTQTAAILGNFSIKTGEVINGIDSLTTAQLQAKLTELTGYSQQFTNAITKLNSLDITSSLQKVLNSFSSGLDQAIKIMGTINTTVIPKLPSLLTNTKSILTSAVTLLSTYQKKLPVLKQDLSDANTLLNGNMDLIVSGLNTASDLYQTEFPTLISKLNLATSFVNNDLPDIEDDLTNTLTMMNNKMPAVKSALTDATDLINNDWPTLKNGLNKAATAINKAEKSVDITQLIKLLKRDASKESAFLANPVTLKENDVYNIPNYGSASAPFYTALCIWVGALLLSNIMLSEFQLDDEQKKKFNHRQQFLARWLTFTTVGILQGLIVALGNIFLLHTYVVDAWAFIWLTLFLAVVFMTILYVLAALFGNVGKGIGIILLVLSISGAGGNFPVVLSGAFFKAINPWLPFTYAVNMLREPVGGIYWPNLWTDIIILTIYFFIFLIGGLLLKQFFYPFFNRLHKKATESKIIH